MLAVIVRHGSHSRAFYCLRRGWAPHNKMLTAPFTEPAQWALTESVGVMLIFSKRHTGIVIM